VVGSLASLSAGAWVTAEGCSVQDRESGLQFKAQMLSSTGRSPRRASRNTWAALDQTVGRWAEVVAEAKDLAE
jgi:hypothetical protein